MRTRILIGAMLFTMLMGLFGCGKEAAKTVTSVESMTLILRGMRGGTVYKFEAGENETELRRYRELYRDGEDILELEKSVPCDEATMTGLMNTCTVIRWDGFNGEHPKNVQDGIMFRFDATVNGTENISAEGSENFPNGYREFVRTLDTMLAGEGSDPVRGLETGPFSTKPLSAGEVWTCSECGTENSGRFCSECGMPFEK